MTPTSFYKITLDLLIGLVYLLCYVIDPLCVAFYYEPLYNTNLNRLQRVLTIILVINMILVPFSARLKKIDLLATSEDEPAIGASMSFLKN